MLSLLRSGLLLNNLYPVSLIPLVELLVSPTHNTLNKTDTQSSIPTPSPLEPLSPPIIIY